MKEILHTMIAAAALALAQAAPASAGVNDPEKIIYRFVGVADNGGDAGSGISTAIVCTNFSGATENIRFVTRDKQGSLLGNVFFSLNHLATGVAGTHLSVTYPVDLIIIPDFIGFTGTTAVAATSMNIVCSATTVDTRTAPFPPSYVPVRGIRFLPIPGTQE